MHITFGRFLIELWPLIDVRILLMFNILWINLWILIKFCVCVDIDKTKIWMSEQYFLFIFNRGQNFVYAQYLVDQLMDFDNIL